MLIQNMNPPAAGLQKLERIGPFGLIVLLHIVFIYALNNGLLREAVRAVPEEVVSIFIATDLPRPSQEEATRVKSLPTVKMALTVPPPVLRSLEPAPIVQVAVETAATPPAAEHAPAAVAVAPAPSRIQTISSGVEYVRAPKPEYPPIARRMGEEGKVLLRILVNERGHPEHVEVQKSSGSTRLDEAARQAALLALFKPHMEDGKAVAVYALIPIGFHLNA